MDQWTTFTMRMGLVTQGHFHYVGEACPVWEGHHQYLGGACSGSERGVVKHWQKVPVVLVLLRLPSLSKSLLMIVFTKVGRRADGDHLLLSRRRTSDSCQERFYALSCPLDLAH